MEKQLINNNFVQTWLGLSHQISEMPVKQIWTDYDKEADVLYLSFRRPQRAKINKENILENKCKN